MTTFDLDEIARLPIPQDNAAVAVRRLEPGTVIAYGGSGFELSATVLPGHRFAVRPIQAGEKILSWGQPFGLAVTEIMPGDYICNEAVLRELRHRSFDFPLPAKPNFVDQMAAYVFDETHFQPAPALARAVDSLTFQGYRRPGSRGVGTRNTIVLLAVSSLANGFVRALETRLKPLVNPYPHLDGIVGITHTEGGHEQPNNRDLLLRTLAGFIVHPNVGAALVVDYGGEAVNAALLRDYMTRSNYPLAEVLHEFMSLSDAFQPSLDKAAQVVEGWLETVNQAARSPVDVSALRVALQCGGSDAFSGISGNPLCSWVTKEILQYGGAANLAETDELIGAEAYVLQRVRDVATARNFLATLERFKNWAAWHGQSAHGNPSGGNLYRGLYNIYLKSLGAATKRHPDVRLDAVLNYAEPMLEPGFYFMDSPGNDLESIAGQVASGCNLIFFTTGNGSITNFPFVPTLKIVTTSERYRLLPDEMDVNAGLYLDGLPLEHLGADTLQLALAVASGQPSAGERAGHAQVQIWRDWRLTEAVDLSGLPAPHFSGEPLPVQVDVSIPDLRFPMLRTPAGYASDQVGLLLPTSLCSGQIAHLCADHLNESNLVHTSGISRFVALTHTEGCGSSTVGELLATLRGYLLHPLVKRALLLEHGCEKTHNQYVRHWLTENGLDPDQYGWASVQLDGGIQKVMLKVAKWFEKELASASPPELVEVGLGAVSLGLVTRGLVSDELARQFALLTGTVAAVGGSVVLPRNDALFSNQPYWSYLSVQPHSTLAYAQAITQPGLHVAEIPSLQWSETLTGLGAAGVHLSLAHIDDHPMSAHPLIPVLQVSRNPGAYPADWDAVWFDSGREWYQLLLDLIAATLARRYTPRMNSVGNTDFQITRGFLGISL